MFQFTKSIVVEGVHHRAGDVVAEAAILPGCFASLRRLGHLVPVPDPDPAETFEALMTAPPAPDAAADMLTLDAPAEPPAPPEPPKAEPPPKPKKK